MDISVIVAAYNADKTIERCLHSIIAQTFSSFEVLVVDDGSSDGTPALLETMAAGDDRARVFTQDNRGPAAARAAALLKARGKYIAFVDADDTVEPGFLSTLFEATERAGADLAVCAHTRVRDGRRALYPMENGECSIVRIGLESFLLNKMTKLGHTIWGKLYRADVIRDNRLTFFDTRYSEDFVFNLCFYCYADNIVTLSDPLYNYFITPGSIMAGIPSDIVPRMLRAAEGYDAFLTERDKRGEVGLYTHAVWLQKAYDALNVKSREGLPGIRACLRDLDSLPALRVHVAALRGRPLGKKAALKYRLFILRPKWLRALLIWLCLKILLSKSLR